MRQLLLFFISFIAISVSNISLSAIVPIYQQTSTDPTWTETSNQGEYTVATSAEDYDNEVWERPVQDNEWNDSGGVRTSNKLYRAYGDLRGGAWGIGTNADNNQDYIFARWEVVGAFEHEVGKSPESKPLEGHYYFYFEPAGKKGFAIEVPSGKDLGTDFDDVSGKVNILFEASEGNTPGSSSEGYENSQVKGKGRTNTSTFVTEAAVPLSDFGLSLSDFDIAVDYAYIGVSVSNPSSPADLFANEKFAEAQGSGQEYDTIKMGHLVPEPSAVCLLLIGLVASLCRTRRHG